MGGSSATIESREDVSEAIAESKVTRQSIPVGSLLNEYSVPSDESSLVQVFTKERLK
jgi:hypothetical protein